MKLPTANELEKYARSKQFASKRNGKNNYLHSNLSAAAQQEQTEEDGWTDGRA